MKNIFKSLASLLTLLTAVLVAVPQAEAGVPYPNNLYLTQHTDVTCTLVSNVMMLRARMYLANNNNWPNLTEESVMPVAWINGAGQRSNYTYSGYGATMTVNQAYVNGLTVASLQQILNAHPEGVCIYVTSIPHAQWITDIENGVVYSADSSCTAYFGRRPLANTWQGQCCGYNQNTVLANVSSYWYISSTNLPVVNTTGSSAAETYARTIPDGRYRIACKSNPEYGLDVSGASQENNANVWVYKYTETTGSSCQEFDITWNGEFYNMKACHSGKNLDLYAASNANGTRVIQYEPDGTDVQKWTLKHVDAGVFNIINYNGLYMDVKDGNVANGTTVQGMQGNGSDAQKWIPILVERSQELPEGDYRIATVKDTDYGLDCQGGGTDPETNVQLYKYWGPGDIGSAAQTWSLRHVGNGYYSIISKKSGLALNLRGAPYVGGANIQLWNYAEGDIASMWRLKETGDGSFYVVSPTGKFLDLSNGTVANGTNIGSWTGNRGDAQKWRFIAVDGEQTLEDGVYNIRSYKDQKFGLDVQSGSKDRGANIQLWTLGDGYNQKWKVKHIGNGYYSIVAAHSGLAMDMANAAKAKGGNVQQYLNTAESENNIAEHWIIRDAGDGAYYIINYNGLFLDIFGGTMANGTNIQGWYGNGTPAQKWVFTPTFCDDEDPQISDVEVTDITSSGYRVTCTVSDNVGVKEVKMPTWTVKDNQDDIQWVNATLKGNKASAYIKVADHNNEHGAYLTHIYAYDKAGNHRAVSTGNVVVPENVADTQVPRLTDPIISEVTPEGFRVTCRVSDDTFLREVDMAVWTENGGQDDLVWHGATISTSGDLATCYVKVKDHNNEMGNYIVHIYAWDQANNSSGINAGKVYVPVTNGYYRVACASNTEYGLDVQGAKTDNGTNVFAFKYHEGANEHFEFKYNGKGYYEIIDINSGKALYVKDANRQAGANIQIHQRNNSAAQLWRIVKNVDDTYTLVSKLGTVLDVVDANIQTGTNNNSASQKWVLIPVTVQSSSSGGGSTEGNGYQTYQGGRGGSGNVVAQGIDVSEHQGQGFNFAAMKAKGVNYVILRCGWVGRKDYRFEEYYTAAKAAGLDVGAYFYSYAENTSEALNEANVCLDQISGKKFEYPIYFDFEDTTYQGYLNSAQSRDICLTFLDRVASQGYIVGLYSMAGWIDEDYGGKVPTATVCQKYECWVANYASNVEYYKNIYKTRYGMYQYSDGGTTAPTSGFGVDSNYCFKDYPTIVKTHHFNGY